MGLLISNSAPLSEEVASEMRKEREKEQKFVNAVDGLKLGRGGAGLLEALRWAEGHLEAQKENFVKAKFSGVEVSVNADKKTFAWTVGASVVAASCAAAAGAPVIPMMGFALVGHRAGRLLSEAPAVWGNSRKAGAGKLEAFGKCCSYMAKDCELAGRGMLRIGTLLPKALAGLLSVKFPSMQKFKALRWRKRTLKGSRSLRCWRRRTAGGPRTARRCSICMPSLPRR